MAYARFGTRQIFFKLEATEGTPEALADVDALYTFEAQVELDVDTANRAPDSPYFTADDQIETGTRAKITFMADLLGAAVAGNASPLSGVLQAAGMAETLTPATKAVYNTITDAILSATFAFYQGGKLWEASGARGDIDISRTPSDFGKVTFTYTGIVDESSIVSTAAIPAIDISAFRDAPVIVPGNWLVTMNAVEVECVGHSLKFGGGVNYIATSKSGRVLYTERKPSGTITILLPDDLGPFNPWAIATARTRIAIVDTLDGGATLLSKITCGSSQLLKPKKNNNYKGGVAIDIPYIPRPTSAGNDEILFEFS
jgi:hypothetical protein